MNPLYRILDANGNRAREGLRVLEDIARFALNDGAASEELKRLRHALVEAIGTLTAQSNDPLLLLEARDTPGDVGTSISTPSETARTDLIHLVRSNASRLGEALRSMEEAAKALNSESGPFERARYSVYTVERLLVLALAKPAIPRVRLCVLLTGSMCVLPWQSVAEASLAGGCNMIQVREKEMSDRELLARVRCVMEIRDRLAPPALVIVNDRPDIARLAGADGVHVGQGDLTPADARTVVGERALVGVSTGTIEEARAAVAMGADLCGVGPMFATSTKDKPVTHGPEYLSAYLADAAASRAPHLAIGGITPENLPQLVARGCRGIAVSSVVCRDKDPEAVCRLLWNALNAGESDPHRSEERVHHKSR
ncbi:MAG: thiamine phosphate synthase [Phycisphaeraceae bacterium]|nr:MAG: thiamine phosphate synthase [Phycisphaeraceae bacterium]